MRTVFRLLLSLAFFFPFFASPAFAAVEIAFYSRELGSNFPHAFVVLKGTVDATGEEIDASFGFTAHSVTPAALFGSVRGELLTYDEREIARSDRQFAVTLTDTQYRAAMAVVEAWRNRPQPSYNLRRHNCVHFIAEIAQAIGLRVENAGRLMRKPRSFLQLVRSQNPQLAPPGASAPNP